MSYDFLMEELDTLEIKVDEKNKFMEENITELKKHLIEMCEKNKIFEKKIIEIEEKNKIFGK